MTRKVAFLGTSCAGKTTIAQFYKMRTDLLFDLQVIDEIARWYFETHIVDDHFSVETQQAIQSLVIKTEIEHIKKLQPDVLLCDSTVVNPILWTMASGDMQGAKRLLESVSWWLPTYDVTFVFDPDDVEFVQDARVRVEDYKLRMKFHELLLEFLSFHDIEYFYIQGSVAHRVELIDSVLHQI